MELENASIAAELSSSIPNNQINALLVLLRLYSAGKDVQNYVSIVIQSVLVKSNDPLVRKLCYQMIKCCTITNKYDWDFLLKEIVRDISNQQNNDLCVWALRSAVSICGTGARFQEFFIKNQRQIEECIFRTSSANVRITALGLIKVFAKSIRKTNMINNNSPHNSDFSNAVGGPTGSSGSNSKGHSNMGGHITTTTQNLSSSVAICGEWILRSIEDNNQEVAYQAFLVLRELICADSCVCHFHQENLPITVSVESMKWITYTSNHYSFLLSRVKCMDARRRYPALRPLTYISLLVKQNQLNNVQGSTMAVEHDSISIDHLIKPMLQSVDCATVLEAAHCMLLTLSDSNSSTELMACTNNYIDKAIDAYLDLLGRNESAYSHQDIMKDVCCLLNRVRDKYSVSAHLIDNVTQLTAHDENLMYILINIYRTLCKCSISAKLKQFYLSSQASNGGAIPTTTPEQQTPTEIELIFKEAVMQHLWQTPGSTSEKILRCEMLFVACREFLLLKPLRTSHDNEVDTLAYNAWITVGIELCDQGKDCLLWDGCPGLNTTIAEFGKVCTCLCVETYSKKHPVNQIFRKRMTKILNQLLDMVLQMKTEFAELISMCILSNYVDSRRVAGKESADVVFDHTKFMLSSTLKSTAVIEKQKVDTLLYCLFWICLRFSIKLRDIREYLTHTISQRSQQNRTTVMDPVQESLVSALSKVDYVLEHFYSSNLTSIDGANASEIQTLFGRAFTDDHPIFKSYYTPADYQVLNMYIRGNQMLNDINSRLHQEDPYNLKSVLLSHKAIYKTIQLETEQHDSSTHDRSSSHVKQHSAIVSRPGDPLAVTATYVLMPDQYSLILHVRIQNNTSINVYQASVEVGVEGTLRLFEQSPQTHQHLGDLSVNATSEFEREFLIENFSLCSFFISVQCSHIKRSIGDDMLNTGERKDAGLVTIRCEPFHVKLAHLLYPPKLLSHSDFLTVWETVCDTSFHKRIKIEPLVSDSSADGQVNNNGKIVDLIRDLIEYKGEAGKKVNYNSLIAQFYHIPQPEDWVVMKADTVSAISTMTQHCLCSRTIFGDYIMLVVTGVLYHNQKMFVYDWEIRTSSTAVQQVLKEGNALWFNEMIQHAAIPFKYYNITMIDDLPSNNKTKYDVFCDSSTEEKFNVKQEFGLNEAQSTVMFLQKWSSISSRLVVDGTEENEPAADFPTNGNKI